MRARPGASAVRDALWMLCVPLVAAAVVAAAYLVWRAYLAPQPTHCWIF